MNPIPLFLLAITLPLLLGGCVEKPMAEVKPEEPLAETKPKKETPLNPLKYKISENYVTITGYEKSAPDKLIIPASIEGKPVTDIGWSGFKNNLKLTSITE